MAKEEIDLQPGISLNTSNTTFQSQQKNITLKIYLISYH